MAKTLNFGMHLTESYYIDFQLLDAAGDPRVLDTLASLVWKVCEQNKTTAVLTQTLADMTITDEALAKVTLKFVPTSPTFASGGYTHQLIVDDGIDKEVVFQGVINLLPVFA
jgi:hypothetical protein